MEAISDLGWMDSRRHRHNTRALALDADDWRCSHPEPRSSARRWRKLADAGDSAVVHLADLTNAREALATIDDQSRDEGYALASKTAKSTAARLFEALFPQFPRHYEIYPTIDREIAVEMRGARGRSVLVLCDSDGGATCFVTIDGKNRRARYDDASRLPDLFVKEAISDLTRG